MYSKKKLEYMKKKYNQTKEYLDKSAIIISNTLFKNLINKLIFSIYKPIKPNKIVSTLNEAFEYLKNENNI